MTFWSEVKFTISGDDYGSETIFCFGPAHEENDLVHFLDCLHLAARKRRIETIAIRRGPPEEGECLNIETILKDVGAILDEIEQLHVLTGGSIDF